MLRILLIAAVTLSTSAVFANSYSIAMSPQNSRGLARRANSASGHGWGFGVVHTGHVGGGAGVIAGYGESRRDHATSTASGHWNNSTPAAQAQIQAAEDARRERDAADLNQRIATGQYRSR